MSKPYYSILTNVGENLVAKATALGTKLDLTTMAVGDGNGKLPAPDPAQTKLINEKRRAAVNSLEIDKNNPNIIIVEHIIPETEGGWWVREIGLFDSEGNLIAVGNCPETYKPKMIEGSGRTQIIRMMIVVKSTDCIEFKSDPSVVLATREYVDNANESVKDDINHFNEELNIVIDDFNNITSSQGTLVSKVENVVIDDVTDNRNAIFSFGKDVFVPRHMTLRCNLQPDDDVTIFKGEGKILTKDRWGNEHIFDIKKANDGSDFTVRNRIHQSCKSGLTNHVSIGIIGDSITDGQNSKADWASNPVGGAPERNLISTDYDHSNGGGSMSWFAHFGYLIDEVLRRFSSSRCRYYNAACSGKQLADGWAYRNFDYGFFQNKAYANKAPDICLLSMGWNDDKENDFIKYEKEFDKFIRKAWGYGCAVGVITVNTNDAARSAQESIVKRGLAKRYKNVEYFDLSQDLRKFVDTDIRLQKEMYINQEGTLDITHPKALGHAVLAGSMVKQVFHETFIPTLKNGEVLGLTNADKYWNVSGVTSKKSYNIRKVILDRSEQLKEIGILAKADIDSEDVDVTTYVWCDDDDSELIVVETRATDFTTEARNHTINIKSPGGLETGSEYQTLITNGALASSALGDNRVLSTDVCKLRYGLNRIIIRYTGRPNQVYVPILIINKRSMLGAKFDMKRVTRLGTQSALLFKMGSVFANNITSNLYDGSSFAKLPDWYAQVSSGDAVVTVHGGIKQDGAAIITNYDAMDKTGVAIKRTGSVLSMGKLVNDIVEKWELTTLDATGDFSAHIYQANGINAKGVSVRLVDIAEKEYSAAFDKISGGTVGCFTADDVTPVTFTVSFAAYKTS
ncbi:phage tail-collar fiber domain-containing protein [Providencia stuartii]|uniref:phage tail-collar fiber domain-containing protein n=1 Tax=Providencia stuartii TaxID=588 RepID=UPI0038576538